MTAGAGTVLLPLESDREVLPAIYIPDDYGLLLPIVRGFSPLADEIWWLIFTRFGGERVKVMRPVFAQIVRDLNSRVPSADGCDYKTLQCIRRLPSVPEYGSHTTGHRPPRF